MTDHDPDVEAALDRVHDHVAATGELPVEREAGHWLGEAEAVADDLRSGDPDRGTLRRRLGTVIELLAEADDTGNPEADEHVRAAREAARDLRDRL